MGSKRIEMELYSESSGSSVITKKDAPVVSGDGTTDYLCGGCGIVVCHAMREGEIDGVLFRCPKCWRVNRVKT